MKEITIKEFINNLFLNKKLAIICISISLALGTLIAFTSPLEWSTTTTFLPSQNESSTIGSLGGLAGLAGINIPSSGTESIPPEIYPSIIETTPFLTQLLEQEFEFATIDQRVTIEEFLKEHQKSSLISKLIGLPSEILAWLRPNKTSNELNGTKSDFISISKERLVLFEIMKPRIIMGISKTSGIISIEVKMQDPLACAQVAKFTQDYVKNYVSNYSLSKKKNNLEFISEQLKEKRTGYEEKQMLWIDFETTNRGNLSGPVTAKRDNLRNELDLAFNIYSTLAGEFEQAKLTLEENRPIFTVFEPIKVPTERYSPKRKIILFFSLIIGFVLVSVFVVLKQIF